jgi:GH15 family glucan-1,4-alpha-glucosidase
MIDPPKIQDYAIIWNGRSAASISRGDFLDWLCWPRFDSSSLFGGLLDCRRGGVWAITPKEPDNGIREFPGPGGFHGAIRRRPCGRCSPS